MEASSLNDITLDATDQLLNTEYTPNTPSSSTGAETESDSVMYQGEGDSLSEDVIVAEGIRYRRTYHERDNIAEDISDTEL